MLLSDLLDVDLLASMIDAGYVGIQTHPTEPLAIYNYTHAAQYDQVWNPVTRQCRGLIVRFIGAEGARARYEVVARPWPKFHNYGEHEEGSLDLGAPCTVTDKVDGSLGILYPMGSSTFWQGEFREARGGCPVGPSWAIATRGSFTSEQALHATAILRSRYGEFVPRRGITYLYEIVYPENRIVVDYGDTDDLVLLDVLVTETGAAANRVFGHCWPGHVASTFSCRTLADALALDPRTNAEGVVVRFADGEMLKIKQEDYVALHKIVTGLNERTVWAHLASGGTVAELCEPLPDEFHEWVGEVAEGLDCAFQTTLFRVQSVGADILTGISLSGNRDWTRKEFAEAVSGSFLSDIASYLFLWLDGKDERLAQAIWRDLKPAVTGRWLRQETEDTA